MSLKSVLSNIPQNKVADHRDEICELPRRRNI